MKHLKAALLAIPFTLLVLSQGNAQDQAFIDSLLTELSATREDTLKVEILIALGEEYIYNLPDTAMDYFQEALQIAEQLESLSLQAASKRSIGVVTENQGRYDQALEEYFAALALFEQDENKPGIASCYNDIAIIHYLQGSSELCMEYLTLSFEIKEELGDKDGMSSYYINMSALNNSIGKYEEALEFAELSIDLHRELGDQAGIATGYGNIGTIHYELGNYQSSLENHMKSVEMHREINNKDGMAHSMSNVAGLYMLMADSVARTENQQREYLNQAVSYGLRCYALTEELDALYVQNYVANTLHGAYRELGEPWKALEYAEIFISTRDSLFNEEKTRAIEEMDTKYETEKQQQQIELQESQIVARDAEIRQQKTLRNALIAGLLAVILIIVVVIIAYVQKRRDNQKIQDQNAQILEANEELTVLNEAISRQNTEIMDSITYAQRIQTAMMPPEGYFNELLDEAFILYKPRDIVSGDFFWIRQVNQFIVLAAADCTGHGVPGAFMSLLGISFLNEIVQRREITQASEILNELRRQIKNSLRQHGQPDETKDGIDMALCAIDQKNRTMQYAGAFNPLYLIREEKSNAELIEFKADRMPLGYYMGKDRAFTNHEIELEIGDTFYIFSDGFIDQKGGPDQKKFMSKKFKNLLLEIHDEPMFDQKNKLEKALTEWMGNQSQIDDILVVGVRV
jgi:serine phosphatase RsbU (regulator of sigma subunit)